MRLLPAAVVLVAVCAAAGCTTVSASPPALPAPAPSRGAPDVVRLTPPPARPLLATAAPDAAAPAAEAVPPPARTARAPRRRHVPAVRRRRRPVVHRAPRTPVPRVPAAAGACALGRTYGGWAADSPTAALCARS
ncbi:hypothetical protein [Actinacidiphila paucisporea]|uniref:hypothetical protein n=1 Tax=Actinacidiphila paucisporea TaxID=310782 RepID=UPI0009372206|nr:hypothetical protein [Actinacidiphila paucisporea]